MASAELGMRIEASADRVWEVLSGPELGELITSLYADKAEFVDTEEGLVVKTTLKDSAGVVHERIESFDNKLRCMKYRVIDYGPLPYTNYSGEAWVFPSGPDACHLSFQCTYIPVGMAAEESNKFWLEHNTEVMLKLKEFLNESK